MMFVWILVAIISIYLTEMSIVLIVGEIMREIKMKTILDVSKLNYILYVLSNLSLYTRKYSGYCCLYPTCYTIVDKGLLCSIHG